MTSVLNLFRSHAGEAERFYSLYLIRLSANGRSNRVIEACRQIRRHAARAGQPLAADFTIDFEIDALCKRREFSSAWRQLRRFERLVFRRPIDLTARSWPPAQLSWFLDRHPNILYFLGRFKPARRLMDAILEDTFSRPRAGLSFHMLGYIYKPVPRPKSRLDVTLYHIYRELGSSLEDWPLWSSFVKGFHLKVFQVTGISQQQLLRDPSLLRAFCERISRELDERLSAGVSRGERDLIESAAKVLRYQEDVARKKEAIMDSVRRREQQVAEIFPDLR
ncbi:MAG: hypothetical protein DMG59_15035 [Acidobacteria bacterium]|nr:MAG: hypothetical protein DMG59_15035 [Acidobacteriota bacterium]